MHALTLISQLIFFQFSTFFIICHESYACWLLKCHVVVALRIYNTYSLCTHIKRQLETLFHVIWWWWRWWWNICILRYEDQFRNFYYWLSLCLLTFLPASFFLACALSQSDTCDAFKRIYVFFFGLLISGSFFVSCCIYIYIAWSLLL